MRTEWLGVPVVLLVASARPTDAQALELVFEGEARFEAAIREYREVWRAEGEQITTVLQETSGLTFELGSIDVEVMEGPS